MGAIDSLDLRINKLIVDPFSLDATIPKDHATCAYGMAMLRQLEEKKPEVLDEVKSQILGYIHEDYRDDFFDNLSNSNLYMNGATHQVIWNAVEQHVDVDDRLTVLYTLKDYSKIKLFAAKGVGLNFIIDNVTKATDNVTCGIHIYKISLQELLSVAGKFETTDGGGYRNKPSCFVYQSRDDYTEHIMEHFGGESFPEIEKKNFDFTVCFFETLPILLTDEKGKYGKTVLKKKEGNSYFFAMHYPKLSLKRRIANLFSNKRTMIDMTIQEELKKQAEEELKVYIKKLDSKSATHKVLRGAIEKEMILSIERFMDISRVLAGTDTYELVNPGLDRIKQSLANLRNMDIGKVSAELDLDFDGDPRKILELSAKLREPHASGAKFERELKKQGIAFNAYEEQAVNLLIEGYNHAVNKEEFIDNFLNVLDKKDTFRGHLYRVADLAYEFCKRANEMGLTKLDPEYVRIAGAIHDCGKILIPRDILGKPGRFDQWEREVVNKHVLHGKKILDGMELGKLAVPAGYHHEYWDGSRGYPQEVKLEEIPEIARIISYIDVLDAIAGSQIDRAYDKINMGRIRDWTHAVVEIQKCQGTQFDPKFMPALISMVEDDFLHKYYVPRITGEIKSEEAVSFDII
ncbi:HD domain-containing protein [Candidatus Woesearchaeota archaeon]|nr:HD domain-containing protein [Candidatus Woesearchaeota archaeon]